MSDLFDLLDSWAVHLRAEHKSPNTIDLYTTGVRRYLAFCAEHDLPAVLDRAQAVAFVAALLEHHEPSTASIRQTALRRFSAWLVAEGELDADPLAGLRPPKVDAKVVQVLSDDQLRALLAACQGQDFCARRDEAIVRLLLETGLRASELLGLVVDDVDTYGGMLVVRRGKGGAGRVAPFSPQAARSLDRYLRLRRRHRLAASPAMWLGHRGAGFGYDALHKALRTRAAAAGIPRFHVHVLRHTAASRWLAAGGSEGGAMTVFGWKGRHMLDRYVASTAAMRAAAEARTLQLGEL
jgi:site-specific recombinase XerD